MTVLAASSLTDAFDALSTGFERAHPGSDVIVSYAGSHTLTLQVEQGLDADIITTADSQHIARLVDADRAHHPTPIASNRLVLTTPRGASAPHRIDDLATAERLVLALPEVPLGRYTDALLTHAAAERGDAWLAQVNASVVSREPNARLVVAKVALGEADAAIVYATDVVGRDALVGHELPEFDNTRATYVQARLSEHPLGQAWADWVVSTDGQRILSDHGFGGRP